MSVKNIGLPFMTPIIPDITKQKEAKEVILIVRNQWRKWKKLKKKLNRVNWEARILMLNK
jgi:hypothetical protein